MKRSEQPRRGRLIAVSHVHLEAAPGIEPELHWFYGDLIGLRLVEVSLSPSEAGAAGLAEADTIRFRSDRTELRIKVTEDPDVDPIACRAYFEVPFLAEVAEVLDERKYEYELCQGLRFTDRYLSLLDPAGNRVILRRHWPTSFLG